jgi:hypothetical protein
MRSSVCLVWAETFTDFVQMFQHFVRLSKLLELTSCSVQSTFQDWRSSHTSKPLQELSRPLKLLCFLLQHQEGPPHLVPTRAKQICQATFCSQSTSRGAHAYTHSNQVKQLVWPWTCYRRKIASDDQSPKMPLTLAQFCSRLPTWWGTFFAPLCPCSAHTSASEHSACCDPPRACLQQSSKERGKREEQVVMLTLRCNQDWKWYCKECLHKKY